jgi:hypothetical protein
MSTITIRLPETKHQRLKAFARAGRESEQARRGMGNRGARPARCREPLSDARGAW